MAESRPLFQTMRERETVSRPRPAIPSAPFDAPRHSANSVVRELVVIIGSGSFFAGRCPHRSSSSGGVTNPVSHVFSFRNSLDACESK